MIKKILVGNNRELIFLFHYLRISNILGLGVFDEFTTHLIFSSLSTLDYILFWIYIIRNALTEPFLNFAENEWIVRIGIAKITELESMKEEPTPIHRCRVQKTLYGTSLHGDVCRYVKQACHLKQASHGSTLLHVKQESRHVLKHTKKPSKHVTILRLTCEVYKKACHLK